MAYLLILKSYLWRTTIALLIFNIYLLIGLCILFTARRSPPSQGQTAPHKANTRAGKATRTMTPVEEECYYMVNTIKEYSNKRTIIIAVLKEQQSFRYLKRKYRPKKVIPSTDKNVQSAMREACKLAGRRKNVKVVMSSYLPYMAYFQPSAIPSTAIVMVPKRHQEEKVSCQREAVARARFYSPKEIELEVTSKGKPGISYDTFIEIWNAAIYEDGRE
ncbi:hypothetical protein BDV33DRAFT_229378 [Aspergillus novoparasiticus]|uniref:Uncharacterized protein n=1 Tax=Aspergillus novoparasiticus TaxID=986946 RepID=A0A5N6E7I6_9EURO|nr:hypothetical protein BDV33DRAFT_229378 [Aspergillus novoparasiticus]